MTDEDKTDEDKTDEKSAGHAREEGEPPLVSVKTLGRAASDFDAGLTKGLAAGVGGAFKLFSTRLRKALQSGHWQNYAFIVFAAIIFAAGALVLYMQFFGR